MLGDQPPLPFLQQILALQQAQQPANTPAQQAAVQAQRQAPGTAALLPRVRGFKIAENESPRPQDRVYFSFNYFDNLNASTNRRLGTDLSDVRAYRETFGVEKTVLDGNASVGLRLPLNTLSAEGSTNLGGTTTAVGDLAVIFKYALVQDPRTGDVLSAGLAVVAPTGPEHFAGSALPPALHRTTLQPFTGYLWNLGPFYLHGFTAVDVPTDERDVTMLYNDVGIGYFLYRQARPERLLTAVVPTVELHVDTPLNHRGVLHTTDPAGTPDVLNLTFGTNFELYRNTRFAVGVVTPVTGPRPFDFEVVAQLRMRF
jgi:hypothetical protein